LLDTIYKKASRNFVMATCFWLPEQRKIHLERWLRGRHESGQLQRAEVVVASFGKSGRTWLRVLLSRYYDLANGIDARPPASFINLSLRNPAIPRIFFTHDNYIKDYSGHFESKADFYDHRVVLLVRDPRDVTVSQYFQWRHRMNRKKTRVNHYPPKGTDVSIYDFVMDPVYGMVRCIEFMNLWAREADKVQDLLIVRYEDMRREPAKVLTRIVEFISQKADPEMIEQAVDYASVENMRKLESRNTFAFAGGRLKPGDKNNPDSYKVRRAKVGGYRDYFTDEEIAAIDANVSEHLDPALGY
jgi:hypothetical protein